MLFLVCCFWCVVSGALFVVCCLLSFGFVRCPVSWLSFVVRCVLWYCVTWCCVRHVLIGVVWCCVWFSDCGLLCLCVTSCCSLPYDVCGLLIGVCCEFFGV